MTFVLKGIKGYLGWIDHPDDYYAICYEDRTQAESVAAALRYLLHDESIAVVEEGNE